MMSLDKSSLKILDFVFKLMAKKLVSILVNVLPVSEKVVICQLTNHQYRLFCCKRLSICYFLYGSSWNDAVILNAYISNPIFCTHGFDPLMLRILKSTRFLSLCLLTEVQAIEKTKPNYILFQVT